MRVCAFTMALRLYGPKEEALQGKWTSTELETVK
jgi:hypothetical protein